MNKKSSGLLLIGIAAFLYYRYSKLNTDQKKNLINNLKQQGKQLFKEYFSSPGAQKTENVV